MRFQTMPLASKLPNWSLGIKDSANRKWWDLWEACSRSGTQLTDPTLCHSILKACSGLPVRYGKSVHASSLKQGLDFFTSTGNSILDFYMKAGELDSVLRVFYAMGSRDSVSWNIMIHGYLSRGDSDEGLQWFREARVVGFEPNVSTLVLATHACRSLGTMDEALEMHGYIIRKGLLDILSVQNSLLSAYADTRMELAKVLFDEMRERDVISWSVMFGGYVHTGEAQMGLQLFLEMMSDASVELDGITIVSVLKACTSLGYINMGRSVHGVVISKGLNYDLIVGNSIVDMYSKCDDHGSASKAFNEMPYRNSVSWNAIISGLVRGRKYSEALSLFYSMGKAGVRADGVTLVNLLQTYKYFLDTFQCKSIHSVVIRWGYGLNELVMNSLIDAYAKCGLIEHAWKLFDGLKTKDTVSWSTMMAGFNHCGKPYDAIALFHEMNRAGEKPNGVTVLSLLEAASVSADLKRSKCSHAIAIRRGFAAEVAVGTAILDMYSKCGEIGLSRKAFYQIPEKNIVSWGAMIAACGMNGLAHDALTLLAEMKLHGLKPNAVTTLSVLSACSHGGLVDDGLSFFENMVEDHGVEPGPEHYSCMVDMLGRAGKLDSAMNLIEHSPDRMRDGAGLWGALLSACRSSGNSKLGAGAASRVLELEPLSSAGYFLASSMYAASGLWADAAKMRWLVKARGVRVVAGYSLVHVEDRAWRFLAGDKSHPKAAEIWGAVEQLHGCMKIDQSNERD